MAKKQEDPKFKVGDKVSVVGFDHMAGEVSAITEDPEFPITVEFPSGIEEDFAPHRLRVREDV